MRSRSTLSRLRPLAAALAVFALLGACNPSESSETNAPTSTPVTAASTVDEARLVRTVQPEAGALQATRSASANIRAVQDATVASGASARVDAILAREGDTVAAGAVVLQLDADQARLQRDNAELAVQRSEIDLQRAERSSTEGTAQARASLRAAEANVASLERQAAEVEALVAAGGAARTDLETLQTNLESARANLVQAEDAVSRAERASAEDLALLQLALDSARLSLEQAQVALDETEVVAPFAGTIAELYLEVGEFAGAGAPAFQIQSATEREAVFDVPPEAATELLEQGAVALRYAGRDLMATLTASARPAQQERLVRLTARLDPADAATVPSGALAEVRYDVTLAEGVLIPSGAVASEAGSTWVYLVQEGQAVRVPVDVLAEAGAVAAVRGLDASDIVIHPRPLDVRIGTRVRAESTGTTP